MAAGLLPSIAFSDGSDSRRPSIGPDLQCPEVNPSTLPGRDTLSMHPFGLASGTVKLNFYWSDDEPSPQIDLEAALYDQIVGEIYTDFRNHFSWRSPPDTINIIESTLPSDLGGLYCQSYQTDPSKTVTIFLSPEALESAPEFTRLLAHEMTHHWFFIHHKLGSAEPWIEEGVAYLNEYIVTGEYSGNPVIQYLLHSSASLTSSNQSTYLQQMGEVQLLFAYLYNRLGDQFLQRLLATNMTSVTDMNAAIPPRNALGWHSFQDAFRDFQIAKFVNREDDFATTDADRDRYFLFPTTIKAHNDFLENQADWSGVEFTSASEMHLSSLRLSHKVTANHVDDLIVIDDPSRPIRYFRLNKRIMAEPGARFIQILFEK